MALRPLVGIFKGSHRFKLTPWKESGILKGSDDSKHSCGLSQPLHREHTRDSHTSWFSFTPAQFKHQLEMSNKNYYIRLFLFIRRFVFVCRVFLVGWVFVCLFVCSGGRRYFTSPFEWKGTYQYNNVCHFFQARNYQTPYQNSQVESPSRLTLTSSI